MSPFDFVLGARSESDTERLLDFSLEERVRMILTYQKVGEDAELRFVSPYEKRTAADGATLLIGWDHERDDFRTFRLDRIIGSAITAEPIYEQEEA